MNGTSPILSLSKDTFPEKLTTKNMEQQKRIQYFTSIPFTPEISIAAIGDGGLSSADMEETNKIRATRCRKELMDRRRIARLHVRMFLVNSQVHYDYSTQNVIF